MYKEKSYIVFINVIFFVDFFFKEYEFRKYVRNEGRRYCDFGVFIY